jgi:hypothetical protein
MNAHIRIGLPIALVLLAGGISDRANPGPPPLQATFDDCLARSPKNATAAPDAQYSLHGNIRDETGAPYPNFPASWIELRILAPCQNPVVLNPDGPSNANGEVVWGPLTLTQGGGACTGGGVVEIEILGQPGGPYLWYMDSVRSPDSDGDGLVALNDLQAWQTSFVAWQPSYIGDLDCDEVIALSDLSWWQKHFTAP